MAVESITEAGAIPAITDLQNPTPKNTARIQIRHARLSDVSAISDIQTVIFIDFKVTEYLLPRARSYPEEFHRSIVLGQKSFLLDPNLFVFVAVDEQTNKIVAYSLWALKYGAAAPKSWVDQKPRGWFDWLERLLIKAESQYFDWTLDHLTVPGAVEGLLADYAKASGSYTGKPQLHLRHLAVSPESQGRGIGTQLLRYGLRVGRETNLPVTLMSANESASVLYLREGFIELGDVVMNMGENKESRMPSMVWEPPNGAQR